MGVRTGVRVVLWGLLGWGLFLAGGGVLNHGMTGDVVCSWVNIGPDGEEHLSPMRPGDHCHDRDGGERTFGEQRAAQRAERADVVTGAWLLGAGGLGLGAMSVRRRWYDAESGLRRRLRVRAAGLQNETDDAP